MRALLLTFILSAVFYVSYGQSFEGEVIYSTQCKSKMPGLTDDQLNALGGDTLRYYMKGGDYRSDLNGLMFQWQIYSNHDNKFYTKLRSNDTLYSEDGSINPDTFYHVEVVKNAGVVFGHNCNEIIYTCKSGQQQFWYSTTDYHIDGKLYAKQVYQHWADYLSRANAMPLKIVVDNKMGIEVMTVVGVIEKKIPDSFFVLPANPIIVPSPQSE
jgi:hypothetical protein